MYIYKDENHSECRAHSTIPRRILYHRSPRTRGVKGQGRVGQERTLLAPGQPRAAAPDGAELAAPGLLAGLVVGAEDGVPGGPFAAGLAVLAPRQGRHAHVVGAPGPPSSSSSSRHRHTIAAAGLVPLLHAPALPALVLLAEQAARDISARLRARGVQPAAVVATRTAAVDAGAGAVDARLGAPGGRGAEVAVAEAGGAVAGLVEQDEGLAPADVADLVAAAVCWWRGGRRRGVAVGVVAATAIVAAVVIVGAIVMMMIHGAVHATPAAARVTLAAATVAVSRLVAPLDVAAVLGAVWRGALLGGGTRFFAVVVDAAIYIVTGG